MNQHFPEGVDRNSIPVIPQHTLDGMEKFFHETGVFLRILEARKKQVFEEGEVNYEQRQKSHGNRFTLATPGTIGN